MTRFLRPTLGVSDTRAVRPGAKLRAAHYATPDHQAWAKAVRARAGQACQRCGKTGARLFADHITELKDGGAALDPANGQALCGSCHTLKTAAARAARQRA